jgi:hypothetical protein
MNTVACRTVLVGAVAFLAVVPTALSESLTPKRMTPDELTWITGPIGNQRADIAGDESKPGMYIFRGKLPANFKNAPHHHPDERIGMVISGTLLVGYGEQFDESKMKVMPPGSIWTEPAKQPHFVWAKDGEVVIQITGNGPSGATLVQFRR